MTDQTDIGQMYTAYKSIKSLFADLGANKRALQQSELPPDEAESITHVAQPDTEPTENDSFFEQQGLFSYGFQCPNCFVPR